MCIINIIITECHIVTCFNALLYQSFCTLLLLHNKLISCILVYLGLLHIDCYVKLTQHNILVIHCSILSTLLCLYVILKCLHVFAFLSRYSNIHIIYIDIGIYIHYTCILLSYIYCYGITLCIITR